MKIGIMLRHLPTEQGGVGRYTRKLLQHLLCIDSKNEYFLFHKAGSSGEFSGQGQRVREFSKDSPSKLLWDQVIVPRWVRRLGLDLLFNPKISVPLRTLCKTVIMMHGADWFEVPQSYSLPNRMYHEYAATLYARKADVILAASQDAAAKLEQRVPASRGKIIAIHHGVDEEFHPVRNNYQLAAVKAKYALPDHFILYVGKIYPMKNVSGIITAFSYLRGELPHKLVIVGPHGPRAERELAPIARYGLEKDVLLLGRVPDEDLPAIYSLADVFVFPSLYEGFGIPLLEAMACGCPVVTSMAGSCPEVVDDAAVLVEPSDARAIAAATYGVVTNPGLAQTLKASGLERARSFTWERCARETLAVFAQVLEAGRPDRSA